MASYLYEEDSGEEVEFEAADMDAAKAHGEALLRKGLGSQLAAIEQSGRKVDFPVEVTGHVTEQCGEYNSWADGNPDVPSVKFTASAASFAGTVTECINCGWKQAGTIMTHDEYVAANRMMAWLCAKPSMGPLEAVMPPRPADADPVLDKDGNVTGWTVRSDA